MRKIKLSEIKIKTAFQKYTPKEYKLEECRRHWYEHGKQDRPIVLGHKNFLVDGYVMYLVLKEQGEEYAEVEYLFSTYDYRCNPTTYIYGSHPNSDGREFMWRVPHGWGDWADKLEIGDTILCSTKFGFSPVIVSRIEKYDECPVDYRVKKVVKKEIRRNGVTIE